MPKNYLRDHEICVHRVVRFFEKEEYRRYSRHSHGPDSINGILLLYAQKHAVYKINGSLWHLSISFRNLLQGIYFNINLHFYILHEQCCSAGIVFGDHSCSGYPSKYHSSHKTLLICKTQNHSKCHWKLQK